MLKQFCASLLLLLASVACSGKEESVVSPAGPSSVSPSRSTPTNFSLSGRVITSRTSVPIANASVSIMTGPDTGKSTTTDASGNFSFTELQQSSIIVNVSAAEYFSTRAPLTLNQPLTVFLVPLGPTIVLEGRVSDASTSAPIAGATVYINGRYSATTDASGNYTLPGHLDNGDASITWAGAEGYVQFVRYIRANSSQSFRLRRIERITAGTTWSAILQPDDSLCFNNLQDPSFGLPGSGFLCRTVRVISPADGVLKLEAVSTQDGTHPPLEVEVLNASPCCFERIENPISIKVRAGTEVLVNVEMPERSTLSQPFIVTTSMVSE